MRRGKYGIDTLWVWPTCSCYNVVFYWPKKRHDFVSSRLYCLSLYGDYWYILTPKNSHFYLWLRRPSDIS